jgi:Spy/CpxP family protein refolding chaperone
VTPYWRHLLLTIVLAGAAGYGGVWFGARRLAPPPPSASPMLPAVVSELAERGLKGLTRQQEQQIQAIADRFLARRGELRHGISAANFELANALAEESSMGPRTRAAIERLKDTVGELQTATVQYVLDLRKVLTPDQQTVFDTKVVEALMSDAR